VTGVTLFTASRQVRFRAARAAAMMAFPATLNDRSMSSPATAFRFIPLMALLGALAGAPDAQARNDSFELPVNKAVASKRVREVLGDLPLRFGSATANGADLLPGDFTAQGAASIVSEDPRRREHLKDEETCQLAFVDAVNQLAQEARRAGAAAVVGVVSNFKGQLVDDPRNFDCHAGTAKSYVTLRARFARTWTETSTRPLPRQTDFAALDDVKAVPISDAGHERYAHFLTLPKPRAFVVYEDGGWRIYSRDPEAMTKALNSCARQGRRCWLYAADDRVVWSADVARRIGSTSQLEGGSPKDEHQ
jgi:hypothetical protein